MPASSKTAASFADQLVKKHRQQLSNPYLCPLDFEGMRILLISDYSTDMEFIETILASVGLTHCLEYCDSPHAMTRLREGTVDERCDIDVIMAYEDSSTLEPADLYRRLLGKPEWRGIPVISVMDANTHAPDNTTVDGSGNITDVFLKPFRPAEVLPRLINALRLKHERDAHRLYADHREAELVRHRDMESRLRYLVDHDDITGLFNRRYLEQALERAITTTQATGCHSALMYFDLDQFKIINAAEGHLAGDSLIRSVAKQLKSDARPEDTLTRISCDDFALLIEDTDQQTAIDKANQMRCSLAQLKVSLHNQTYDISASIGVTMIEPDSTASPSHYLAQADQACFIAKNHGRNTVHLFCADEPEVKRINHDASWIPRIRDALDNDGFTLLFQPVYDIARDRVERYEALVRMRAEDGSLAEPEPFIAVAERMGLIHDIDQWVVAEAIRALGSLDPDQDHICLNINLSGHAFEDPSLPDTIRQLLSDTHVDARRITFEITETAAIANFEHTRNMILQIRKLGCRFALDDFGSGFNSYTYLKNLPVDCLKLDGSFVQNAVSDPVDQVLIRSMVEIAQTLGKRTVAEFVENKETLELLRSLGVDYAQGYYIGRPSTELAPK